MQELDIALVLRIISVRLLPIDVELLLTDFEACFVMAHKKGQGSTRNGRDSNPQYRGVKVYGGATVKAGGIIIRQRGTQYHPGANVRCGSDWTIYSLTAGTVYFDQNGRRVNVKADEVAVAAV